MMVTLVRLGWGGPGALPGLSGALWIPGNPPTGRGPPVHVAGDPSVAANWRYLRKTPRRAARARARLHQSDTESDDDDQSHRRARARA